MIRTSTCWVATLPTGSKRPFSRTRSSFTWSFGLISPISSRKIVPPSASLKRPTRLATAPVNAPRSWPNISLSRRSSGIAPQCTGTNRPASRCDRRCSAAATSSFPVPLSPVMRTVASVGATRRITSKIASMLGWPPMMPSNDSPSGLSIDPPPGRPVSKRHARCGVEAGVGSGFCLQTHGNSDVPGHQTVRRSSPPRHTRRTFVYGRGDSRTRAAGSPRLRFVVVATPRSGRWAGGVRVLGDRLPVLPANGPVDFLSVDAHVGRRVHAEADVVALHLEHPDRDGVTDANDLAQLPCQHQHRPPPPRRPYSG